MRFYSLSKSITCRTFQIYKPIMKKFLLILILFLSSYMQLYSQSYPVPEILYYKFNTSTVVNYAIPGQGTNPAILNGGQYCGMTGQFDSALVGVGGGGNINYVNTGWNINLGNSSWTISFWVKNTPVDIEYFFGEVNSSFRCFTGGIAGLNNIIIRKTTAPVIPDLLFNNVLPGPSVIHIVYDSAAGRIKGYINGVANGLSITTPPLNFTSASPLRIGSHGVSNAIAVNTFMDEFRFYKRALDSAEIAVTWNKKLPYIDLTSVTQQNSEVPSAFMLAQNYPNPFNPVTKIVYSIPSAGNVDLRVYDIMGREVEVIQSGYQNAGNYEALFNAENLASGVYTYRIISGNYIETRKMMLTK